MDDDYWGNANNYYLYFGDDKNGARKVWFIPYDYDNTLGASIKYAANDGGTEDGIFQNPLEWGRGANRPLMDRLLLVPEYKAKFVSYLKQVSSVDADSPWNPAKCKNQFKTWQTMCAPFMNSSDLKNSGGTTYLSTLGPSDSCWNPSGYFLTQDPNIYQATHDSIMRWTNDIQTITFDLNGGSLNGNSSSISITLDDSNRTKPISKLLSGRPELSGKLFAGWTATKDGEDFANYPVYEKVYARWKTESEITDLYIYEKSNDENGICIGILNVPSFAGVREVFVNGMLAGRTQVASIAKSSEWTYPFTKEDETYEISMRFYPSDWSYSTDTSKIKVTADKSAGEVQITNKPVFTFADNKLTFSNTPSVTFKGIPLNIANTFTNWETNQNYYCAVEFCTTDWSWCSTNRINPVLENVSLDLMETTIIPQWARDSALQFRLYYSVNSICGEFWFVVIDYNTDHPIRITN